MSYSVMLGERLRNIRLQKGLSLHDVETASQKEFKASVLGAYERGERSVSVPRLHRIAQFYGVPVDQLLPRDSEMEEAPPAVPLTLPEKIRIDLRRLSTVQSPESSVLGRYLNQLQMRRGDFNGKVFTIRQDDLRAIASVLELSAEQLFARIDTLGLKAIVS